MRSFVRQTSFLCVSATLLALAACSGKEGAKGSVDPKELEYLNMALFNHCDQNKKGAATVEDLKPFMEPSKTFDPKPILAKVRSGDIVVPWNVNIQALFREPGGIESFVIV